MNGGSPVTLTSANATTLQPLAVSGVPAGLSCPFYETAYVTANGTFIPLGFGANAQYLAVHSSTSASGDYYRIGVDCATGNDRSLHEVSATQIGVSPGPITLKLPAPLIVQAPTATAFPSFNVNYSGFSGNSAIADSAEISWQTAGTAYNIRVFATEAFQSGSTTLAIPDLTSIPGFLAPAPSGTTVSWFGVVYGGSYFPFIRIPSSGSLSSASDSGTYTEP